MKKKSRPVENRLAWLKIGLITSPFFLLLLFILIMANSKPNPDSARRRAERIGEVQRIVSASGASLVETSAGSLIIVLPYDSGMGASPREAMELALMAHGRTGAIVRVETPAGQTLAKAP